jgi:CBS domain-containing protein
VSTSIIVRDLMFPEVVTCSPDLPLGKVAKLLAEHHLHALFVMNDEMMPVGVITDYDVLAGEWLSGDPDSLKVMRSMTAGELMSSPVEMVDADCPASEAAIRMREGQIRRLLVIDGGRPVGVISVSDFISELASKAPLKRGLVSDVMSDAFLVCRENTPVPAAARAMSDTGWRSVVVVNAHGKPLGVFSGLDFLNCCDPETIMDEIVVSDVMHPPLTISMDATLQEASQMMIENHHHRILVTDPAHEDSVPLGVISSFDIVQEMASPESVWQV